jgi:hypothetical protein
VPIVTVEMHDLDAAYVDPGFPSHMKLEGDVQNVRVLHARGRLHLDKTEPLAVSQEYVGDDTNVVGRESGPEDGRRTPTEGGGGSRQLCFDTVVGTSD